MIIGPGVSEGATPGPDGGVMATQTHGVAPELLTWQQALDRAWERVDENGWRMRVSGYRSPVDNAWHYIAVRGGRRKARS